MQFISINKTNLGYLLLFGALLVVHCVNGIGFFLTYFAPKLQSRKDKAKI